MKKIYVNQKSYYVEDEAYEELTNMCEEGKTLEEIKTYLSLADDINELKDFKVMKVQTLSKEDEYDYGVVINYFVSPNFELEITTRATSIEEILHCIEKLYNQCQENLYNNSCDCVLEFDNLMYEINFFAQYENKFGGADYDI